MKPWMMGETWFFVEHFLPPNRSCLAVVSFIQLIKHAHSLIKKFHHDCLNKVGCCKLYIFIVAPYGNFFLCNISDILVFKKLSIDLSLWLFSKTYIQ